MQIQDHVGFELCEPHAKKVQRFALVSLGLHHEWSGDGHDKLMAIGFPVWGCGTNGWESGLVSGWYLTTDLRPPLHIYITCLCMNMVVGAVFRVIWPL